MAALREFHADLATIVPLAAKDAAKPKWQSSLAATHSWIGGV